MPGIHLLATSQNIASARGMRDGGEWLPCTIFSRSHARLSNKLHSLRDFKVFQDTVSGRVTTAGRIRFEIASLE